MIKSKILNAIEQYSMLGNAKNIAVAVSGGADSMALLNALVSLEDQFGISVSAVHFNHNIRGDEAVRDETFVRAECAKLGIELLVGSADVPEFAKENRLSLEFAARQLRYEYFDSLGFDAIATAHTASDNLETVLLNLARGASLKGLCGIPPKRDNIIRPLILCTRQEIEDFCKSQEIRFVTDSTNLCDDYTRNNIRHNVVPVLKSINASIEDAIARNSGFLREDEEFLDALAQKEFDNRKQECKLNLCDFQNLSAPIAKRVIIKYQKSVCDAEISGYHTDQIYRICLAGGRTSIGNDLSVESDTKILSIVESRKRVPPPSFDVKISKTKNDLFEDAQKVHNLLLKNSFDCDRIVGKLVVRTRMAGDKVKLKNKNCTKSLKKLYTEYSIPLYEREYWPVIADDEGIVWIHRIGVAHRCAADENSADIYKVTVNKL